MMSDPANVPAPADNLSDPAGPPTAATDDGALPIRVLVAKPGLDGHDRGAKVLARAFRDAGFEVIYTGLFQTPEMIANAALQEDVDVVGLSILSGAHMSLFPQIMDALQAVDRADALVVAGGTIPDEDIPEVKAMGIAEIFGPGTPLHVAVDFVREHAPRRADTA